MSTQIRIDNSGLLIEFSFLVEWRLLFEFLTFMHCNTFRARKPPAATTVDDERSTINEPFVEGPLFEDRRQEVRDFELGWRFHNGASIM